MILVTRKKVKIPKKKCSFVGRSYRNYNKDEFQEQICNADWSHYNRETTVENKWHEMLQIIQSKIDISCPLRTIRIKQMKEPWITAPLIELIKDKDKAIKEAKKHKNNQLL